MRNCFLCILLLLYMPSMIWAQESIQNDVPELERPRVALVLSGGGARGFSHIPVIELIEELGIPIDIVIGTSAGAIIGGLYGAGYSGDEIAQELLYLDWPTLFQDATTRSLESALGSHSLEANLVNVQLKSDLSLDLGKGLLTGQNIYNKFKQLTVKIPSYIHFDSLLTPFRAAAVDLLTGELVIMEQGDLVEAMRASMSIPAVFEPFPIDGRYYMDGFTRNNLPIQVAKDLGYDIVIAVEITDRMTEDADDFNSNPLTALNQVLALQQSIVVSSEYDLADLVIYPDIYEYGQMEYESAVAIYEQGKKEAERYRSDLVKLRSKIFPEYTTADASTFVEDSEVLTDDGFSFTFVSETDTSIPYVRTNTYSDLPNIFVEHITFENAFQNDMKTLKADFEKNKAFPIGENEINSILKKAYETGNYLLVTARIDKRVEGNSLALHFYPKQQNTVHLNTAGSFEGSLSNASTSAITLSTTLQLRGINESGGVLSIRGMYLNTTGIELLYMQPVSDKVFLQAKANVFSVLDVTSSGFEKVLVSGSQVRHGNVSFSCGIFFSPLHKLYNELGLHWIDSSLANLNYSAEVQQGSISQPGYAFDFSTRYTFDTLNYAMFPTKGFYNDFKAIGVMPLNDSTAPIVFDVLSTDFLVALPLSTITSLTIGSFLGTNISHGLRTESELITKYGFTTYDRDFFPHIMQRHTYGIHKVVFKTDLLFQPKNQLTILGGQFFAGFGGAAGGVWDDYASFIAFENIEWQASALTGLRIKDSIGLTLRAGAGSYADSIAPFVSLDFMVKHY